MTPHDPLSDATSTAIDGNDPFGWIAWRSNRTDDWNTPDDAKEESPRAWANPHQRRPSRVKNKTPLRARVEKRRRKDKAAKAHRKAIEIALATKRNREG